MSSRYIEATKSFKGFNIIQFNFIFPQNVTTKLEHAVVDKEVRQRGGWTTYSDLLVLSQQLRLLRLWELLYECTLKVQEKIPFFFP